MQQLFGFRSTLVLLLTTALPIVAIADPAVFATPEAATEAIVAALEARDAAALISVFGTENADVALTGDKGQDRETWGAFLSDYRAFHRIAPDGDGRATLYIGRDLWPFPAPLVKTPAGWSFDAAEAREQVLLRRIGQNELDVIDLMRKYVQAQAAYRAGDPDGDGLPSFARSILSAPGKRDGLYWPPDPDAPESPVGDFMARAAADGYSLGGIDEEPKPYLGYYFRVLTRQGPSAPGGAMDYMVNGHMLAGHALLAFPSAYRESGVMTFMVGEAGVVYETDFGPDTLARAESLDSFDPGPGWSQVTD